MTQCPCKLVAVGLPESENKFLTILENAGFQITLFDTGDEAVQQIRNQDVDLIVVDASIPDPIQLCQTIGEVTDAPISLISDGQMDLDSLADLAIDRVFFKPLVIPVVVAHLQAMHRRQKWQTESSNVPADGIFSRQSKDVHCCYHSA